jgi:O-antigen/teichoic acid export membrane protein
MSHDALPSLSVVQQFSRFNLQTILIRGAGIVAAIAMHVTLGNLLGVDEYGKLASLLAVAGCLLPIAKWGWDVGLLRASAGKSPHAGRGIAIRAARAILATSPVLAVVAGIYLWLQADFSDPWVWLAMVIWLIGSALVETFAAGHRGLKAIGLSQISREVARPLATVILFALLVQTYRLPAQSRVAFWSWAVVSLVVGICLGLNYVKLTRPNDEAGQNFTGEKFNWMSECAPFCLVAILQAFLERTDILLIGWFVEDYDVGRYAASSRLASYVPLFLVTACTAAAPLFVESRYSQTQVRRLFRWVSLVSVLGGVPIALILFLVPGPLLRIFGKDFSGDEGVLRLLVLAQLCVLISGPSQLFLGMCGFIRQQVVMLSVASVTLASLQVLGALLYGIYGIAVGSVIGIVIWHGGMRLLAERAIRSMGDE